MKQKSNTFAAFYLSYQERFMKIVIAGAGEVGFHLAKLLSYEYHNITLIDLQRDRLSYIESKLDIKTITGNATSITLLKEAQVDEADLVIAVSSNETVNITISLFAKRLGAAKTIARINNVDFIDCDPDIDFDAMGVDELISTELLATNEIKSLMSEAAFNDMHEFEDGELSMLGILLPSTAPFVGMSVKEAAATFPNINFMPIAIRNINSEETVIPRGDTILRADDLAYFVTVREGVQELYKLTGKQKAAVKHVMILGGSNIGARTAKELAADNFKIKLIEKDKERAFELADKGDPVPTPPANNLIGSVFKLRQIPNSYLYGVIAIHPAVTEALQDTKTNIEEYNELKENRLPFQIAFALLYFGVCVIVLLCAIWMGISVATRIVTPIRRLIGTANEVSAGNLDVAVDVSQSEGDLRFLGETFNEML